MIYKIVFDDGIIDWCTAKNMLHLLKSYDSENVLPLQEIQSIDEISEEDAKNITVTNMDYDEDDPDDTPNVSLYSLVRNDEFSIIASNNFY